MSSSIIEGLQMCGSSIERGGHVLSFESNDSDKQSVGKMLRSLVFQLY